jgi:hypothetical protein
MSLIAAPDWLTKRDGSLKSGLRPEVVLVMVGGQPQYRLDCRPAGGQFMCGVTQTVNGRRLDDPALKYATADAALAGGLDQLRTKLGW